MRNLLLIGPRLNKKDPAVSGGGAVLFENLIEQCIMKGIEYDVIDTNKSNYTNNVISLIIIFFQFSGKLMKFSNVSLHGTAKDYVFIAPVVVFFTRLFRKKMSLRKFAGNFNDYFMKSNNMKRCIIKYVLKHSHINFFETKYLVDYFNVYNANTFWFPNVRYKQSLETSKTTFQKRFLFIGHVKKEKGIYELLEVSNMLDSSYTIDIYGSLVENIVFDDYEAVYRGVLHPDEVVDTMQKYDVLLLPSYREGYPGVIIEALSVGLPIVATKLQGISEMIDTESSILIEAKNCKELKQAIESFTTSNYNQKSLAAIRQFKQFDSEIQTAKFFERIGLEC